MQKGIVICWNISPVRSCIYFKSVIQHLIQEGRRGRWNTSYERASRGRSCLLFAVFFMSNPKACSNTSWVRASVLIWFMTSAAACFHEGSAQLGAKKKSNIRFNATGAYDWDNKMINIWISYSKISNIEVPEQFASSRGKIIIFK